MSESNNQDADRKSGWWRTVLGEYPTGVSLITSKNSETGDDVGMVVGTFSAVSAEPPMISFMATKSSFNYGKISENGKFTASVLGAGHEDLCRSFARGTEDKFQKGKWEVAQSGLARLTDAVAWFDAEITQVVEAGDHDIVIALVKDFGVGNGDAGMPLLFLKGGYGAFTVPKLEFSPAGFGGQLRLVEVARTELDRLAQKIDGDAFVATVAQDSVVVLARANVGASSPATEFIGQSFPFAAPVASVFAVWSHAERVKLWEENSRHILGKVDRPFLEELFARVRERGYAISVGTAMDDTFDRIVGNQESKQSEISQLWQALSDEYLALAAGENWHSNVTAIQVPIFGEDAVTRFELFVTLTKPIQSKEQFDAFASTVLDAAARITKATGGVFPNDYQL